MENNIAVDLSSVFPVTREFEAGENFLDRLELEKGSLIELRALHAGCPTDEYLDRIIIYFCTIMGLIIVFLMN